VSEKSTIHPDQIEVLLVGGLLLQHCGLGGLCISLDYLQKAFAHWETAILLECALPTSGMKVNRAKMDPSSDAVQAFATETVLRQRQLPMMDGSNRGHQDATRPLLFYEPSTHRIEYLYLAEGLHASQAAVMTQRHHQHSHIDRFLPQCEYGYPFFQPSATTHVSQAPFASSVPFIFGGNLAGGLNTSAAAMIPQRQHQHSHNHQFLSQYGYGYSSCFQPSSATFELNPTRDASEATLAPVQFATQSSFQNFATYERGINDINREEMVVPDDRMATQHPPFSCNHVKDESTESTGGYKSNSSSPKDLLPDQTSAASRRTSTPPSSICHPPSSLMGACDPYSNESNIHHVVSLAVPSDSVFLDQVHIFLRSSCIELFATTVDDMGRPGRGARASFVGQVGLRCAWCKNLPMAELPTQAICYPSKRDTIYECVRNYQRKHIEICPCLTQELKEKYKAMSNSIGPNNKSQKMLRAYYAEASSDLGLVDTPKGLIFGSRPHTSSIPSENLMVVLVAAESPLKTSAFLKKYSDATTKNKSLHLKKFEHLASERTREVLKKARKEASALVFPHDFPKVGENEFLLYKQVVPFKLSASVLSRILSRRKLLSNDEVRAHPGLCCRYCAHVHGTQSYHSGMFYPSNRTMFTEFAFTQSLRNHMIECCNVPQEIKNAFEELKRLATEHSVLSKRGSKKKFLEKIWDRIEKYDAECAAV